MLDDGLAILGQFIYDSIVNVFRKCWDGRREAIRALRRLSSLFSSMRAYFTQVVAVELGNTLRGSRSAISQKGGGDACRDQFEPDIRLMTPGMEWDILAKSSLSFPNQQSDDEPKTRKPG